MQPIHTSNSIQLLQFNHFFAVFHMIWNLNETVGRLVGDVTHRQLFPLPSHIGSDRRQLGLKVYVTKKNSICGPPLKL